jgi:hypothetical protein
MNALTAQELKRRGVAAVEDLLPNGPVHVIKRNRPAFVVLSEEEYARLASGYGEPIAEGWTVSDLFNQPAWGTRTKEELDAGLREERDAWGDE